MKKIVFLLFAAAFGSFGCALAQTRFVSEEPMTRKALLEEYTGIQCRYCPDGHKRANEILEANPGNVFVINIHCGGLAAPSAGELDLRTEFGDALMKNVTSNMSFPSGTVNRHVFSGSSIELERTLWKNSVNKILEMSSYVNIAAKGTLNWETRQLEVTVQLYYTGSSPAATNYIHVAMLQDNIIGTQAGGSTNPSQYLGGNAYIHHHALRHLITGQWGDAVSTTTAGSFVEKKYTYTIPATVRNVATELIDLNFVAFVTENKNEVMNACKVQIENQNAPEHYLMVSDLQQIAHTDCDANVNVSIDVTTRIAKSPVNSITFAFESSAGETEYKHNFTTPLKQDTTVTIPCGPIKIGSIGQAEEISVKVSKVNEQDYTYTAETSGSVTKHIASATSNDISIHIWQDKFGKDITWFLTQTDNGDTLVSGGPYPDLSGNSTSERVTNATLAASCYSFDILDKSKDGINSSYGAGHIAINDAKGVIIENDGKYRASWNCMIKRSDVANERPQSRNALRVQPNPAANYSVLSFDLPAAQSVQVRILASNGACVLDLGKKHLNAGTQTIELPVEKLNDGLYFISVQGKKINLNQKLVIAR